MSVAQKTRHHLNYRKTSSSQQHSFIKAIFVNNIFLSECIHFLNLNLQFSTFPFTFPFYKKKLLQWKCWATYNISCKPPTMFISIFCFRFSSHKLLKTGEVIKIKDSSFHGKYAIICSSQQISGFLSVC